MITNREMLRNMTDEELAKYFCETYRLDCRCCPGSELCNPYGAKHNGLIRWLKHEVGEDHETY